LTTLADIGQNHLLCESHTKQESHTPNCTYAAQTQSKLATLVEARKKSLTLTFNKV